jgi:hypothetical protein
MQPKATASWRAVRPMWQAERPRGPGLAGAVKLLKWPRPAWVRGHGVSAQGTGRGVVIDDCSVG